MRKKEKIDCSGAYVAPSIKEIQCTLNQAIALSGNGINDLDEQETDWN